MKKNTEILVERKFSNFMDGLSALCIKPEELKDIRCDEFIVFMRLEELEKLIVKHFPKLVLKKLEKNAWDKDNPIRKNIEFNEQTKKFREHLFNLNLDEPGDKRHYG
jgi:hypothetical protein